MAEALPATSMSLDGKQILMIVVSVIFVFLTVLSAGVRIYGRIAVVRKLFAEDGMLIVIKMEIWPMLTNSIVFMLFATVGYARKVIQLEVCLTKYHAGRGPSTLSSIHSGSFVWIWEAR